MLMKISDSMSFSPLRPLDILQRYSTLFVIKFENNLHCDENQ